MRNGAPPGQRRQLLVKFIIKWPFFNLPKHHFGIIPQKNIFYYRITIFIQKETFKYPQVAF